MADTIKWNDDFATGIATIDKQHQTFFAIYNEFVTTIEHEDLFKVISSRKSMKIIHTVMRLRQYGLFHFNAEESLMLRANYPRLLKHVKEHNTYLRAIMDIEDRLMSGEMKAAVDLKLYVRSWMSKHILDVDQDYAGYIRQAGLA